MQKYVVGLIFALLVSFNALAQMVPWEEGKHYQIISEEATKKPEVKEFFSFWCPACYSFEPIVAQIKAKLDDDVKFDKVHVNFMRFTGPDVQDDATKAMMIARSLKQSDAMNAAIFNYIHQQRATVTGLDDLRKVFIVNGIDAADFDKQAKSFSVNSLVARNNNAIDEYRQHINGVPNFIVNGKYQVILARDLSADDYANLVVWLSEQP
ncbi:thiol:disulfide interchange protein DsbA/DsbL [Glaciecola siphonariae]|uniref:Thiol:disulfide interchange protein n=1 Tax=Glaciecola siphonariae TaxID=521012 RepID=A0ABV9LX70_9ALTE